ncbi:hypothetical protein [Halomonas sp.]|uniref:hypothetical protein n=1 Tax=Halomonas sp. TaxID=1486246 RepID=UPI0038505C03
MTEKDAAIDRVAERRHPIHTLERIEPNAHYVDPRPMQNTLHGVETSGQITTYASQEITR